MNLVLNGSDCEQSYVDLAQRIIQHPDLNHPKRGQRPREIFISLFNHFVKEPDGRLLEKDLALMVYAGPVDEDDSQVRQGVTRLRRFLARYFEENPAETLRVEIPRREYRLEFWNRNPEWQIQPTAWFWSHYLGAAGTSLGVVREDMYMGEHEVLRRNERHLQLAPEQFLRVYSLFVETTNITPGILDSTDLYNLKYRWSPTLAVGLTSESSKSPLLALMGYEKAEFKNLLLPFEDPTGKTLFSDPCAGAKSPAVYLEDEENAYALVTRMNLTEGNRGGPVTAIIAARGVMLERAMEVLSSDAALGKIVASEALGGLLLERDPSIEFQILLRSSVNSVVDGGYEMDITEVYIGDPKLVLARQLHRAPTA